MNWSWLLLNSVPSVYLGRYFAAAILGTLLLAIGLTPTTRVSGQAPIVVESQVAASSDDAHDDDAAFWPGFSSTATSTYAGRPGTGNPMTAGYRFTGLAIPENSTITEAYVEFTQSAWGYIIPTDLTFEDSAAPATFSSADSPRDRTTTAYSQSWSWPRATPDSVIQTPSLVAGVQELLDNHGAIDSLVLLEIGDLSAPTGQYHNWISFDGDPAAAAKIHIEYVSGVDVSPPDISDGSPSGTLPPGTIGVTLSVTTDEDATCRWDDVAGVAFASMANTFATTGGTAHSTPITGLSDGETRTHYVRCEDGEGNANTDDFVVTYTIAVPDLVDPVTSNPLPTGVLPAGTTSTTISVETDEAATCRYGTTPGVEYSLIANTFDTTGGVVHSALFGGLTDDTAYTIYVRCEDLSGNAQSSDTLISFSVAPDLVPPVINNPAPTGVLPSGTTSTTLSVDTDETASCGFSLTPGTAFAAMTLFGVTGGTSHSTVVGPLVDDTAYSYFVRCEDAVGNANSSDFSIDFSVAPPGPIVVESQIASSSDDAHDDLADFWPGFSSTATFVYAGRAGNNDPTTGGYRFTGLAIPELAVITSAYVEFTQSGYGHEIPTILSFEDSAAPDTFTGGDSPSGRTSTAFTLNWTWERTNPGDTHQTPSLIAGIQELVDTYGAVDSVVLLETGDLTSPANQYHTWISYDSDPLLAAKIRIEYVSGVDIKAPVISNGSPAGTLPPGTTSTTVSVETDEDATCRWDPSAGVAFASMSEAFDTTGGTAHSTLIAGLTDGATSTHFIRCEDIEGNANQADFIVTFDIAVPDEVEPITSNPLPTGVLPAGTTATTISVDTDEIATCRYGLVPGVDYDLIPNTFDVTGGTAHSSSFGPLTNDTSYTIYVRCQDLSGNSQSDDTTILFGVAADTVPPVLSNGGPTGILPAGTTSASLTVDTNEAATCAYSETPGTLFAAMTPFDTTGVTSHSTSVGPLVDDSVNTYYIRCEDAAGNENLSDFVVTFAIAQPGPVTTTGQVSASSDDAHHDPDGWPFYSHTTSTTFAGRPGGGVAVTGGYRFTGLDIPAGSTVTEAYIEFTQSGYGFFTRTELAFEDSADPVTFSATDTPNDRWASRGAFSLLWDFPRQSPGDTIQTPSLVDGIQELVDNHGDISAVVLLEDGTPTSPGEHHSWTAYDSSPAAAARLHVEYVLIEGFDPDAPWRFNAQPLEQDFAFDVGGVTVSLDTDEPATCRYSLVRNTPFDSMTGLMLGAGTTSHSAAISPVTPGEIHHVYVRCQDESLNTNLNDFEIDFRILTEAETIERQGKPWQLEFTIPPTGAEQGATLPTIQVSVFDYFGVFVSDAAIPITIQLANNDASAALTGTTTVTSAAGIAEFIDLSVSGAGDYTFVASGPINLLGNWNDGDDSQRIGTVYAEGDTAYIAGVAALGGLNAIDISDPTTPTLLANYGLGSIEPHEGNLVPDGIACISGNNATGANLVDFTDPANPLLLSVTGAAEGGVDTVHNIYCDEQYMYVVPNVGPSVPVFDITDPENPVLVNTIVSPAGNQVHDVTVDNGFLYMYEITGAGNTVVFDISNGPENADHVGNFFTGLATHSGQFSADHELMVVNRETLVFPSGADARIYDNSDPENPQLLSIINPLDLGLGDYWPHESAIRDNVIFIAWRPEGLIMLEISDPSDPVMIGQYDTSTLDSPTFGAYEVFAELGHDRILMTDSQTGLHIFDVTPLPTRSASFTVTESAPLAAITGESSEGTGLSGGVASLTAWDVAGVGTMLIGSLLVSWRLHNPLRPRRTPGRTTAWVALTGAPRDGRRSPWG